MLLIRLSVVVSILLCLIKFLAYLFTHSLVILSDALESIINVVASIFAWYSIYLSQKPKDLDHPYGHGKVEFFSIGFEGAMIFIAGIAIIFQSVQALVFPRNIYAVSTGLWFTLGTGLVNFLLGTFLLQKGKKLNSLTLQGNGHHILSDSYSSIGVLVALSLILITGQKWIDTVASLIAGSIIVYTGIKLLIRSVRGLMDETDTAVVQEIISLLQAHRRDAWIDMHNLRVQRFGNYYHVDCHVTMPYYYTLDQIHEEITKLDQLLNAGFAKGSIEFFIHADPCIAESCGHCHLHACPVRRAPFMGSIEWSMDNLLPNRKHGTV